jgi:site-specific recombinase XerD
MTNAKSPPFNSAVAIVIKFLKKKNATQLTIENHNRVYRQLKTYLDSKHDVYSHKIALQWIEERRKYCCHGTFKILRLAVYRLNDASILGYVTEGPYPYDNAAAYNRIPQCFKVELDAFLETIPNDLCCKKHGARVYCSYFLDYISKLGLQNINQITPTIISLYRDYVANDLKQMRVSRLCYVSHFLKYEAICGNIPNTLWMLILDRFANNADAYKPLASEYSEGLLDPEDYLALVEEMLSNPAITAFSKAVKVSTRRALMLHYLYLALNGEYYSFERAREWARSAAIEDRANQYLTYNHALTLFERYRVTGEIKQDLICGPDYDWSRFPNWSIDVVIAMLEHKRREGYAKSTLVGYRTAALHLFRFLDNCGIESIDQITSGALTRFVINDKCMTDKSRGFFIGKTRKIIEHLADEKLVPATLVLAIPSRTAPKTKIVSTLSNEDIAAIEIARKNAKTPMELRDVAMVTLALHTGLRASDVVRVKLSDISWSEQKIAVTQQKTGKPISLPLSVEAANSIYIYLRNGRPKTSSEFIFVKHRMPFTRLGTSSTRPALDKILGKNAGGFHIIRKTFATKMLQGNAEVGSVTEALGHASEEHVNKYLALDEKRMRMCALSLPKEKVLP